MELRVGIIGNEPGWRLLLSQEGIPHSQVPEAPASGEFTVVAASGEVSPAGVEALRSHLRGGGSVLCSGGVFGRIAEGKTRRRVIRCILGDQETGFFDPDLADIFGQCDIPLDANSLGTDGGIQSAFCGEFGGGHVAVLPFDPAALACDRRSAMKSFYAARRRLPFERVSLVSKGGVRRITSKALAWLHHRGGFPYVHLWYYPGNQRSVFALRIDTDYAGRSEIDGLHELFQRLHTPVSWFVDAGSQRGFLNLYAQFSGDEVGIHCFDHRGAGEPGARATDIRRAIAEFGSAGLHAGSYAAPYGTWDERLAADVEQFNFNYSSEFSYDYDNMPSTPYAGGRYLSTLQVPVHPISVGGLRRQGFGEEEMISYYRIQIERKLRLREPIILYHHPGDGHPAVLESMVRSAKDHALSPTRMADFAAWWRGRSCESLSIAQHGSALTLKKAASGGGRQPQSRGTPFLRIVRKDGMEAFHAPEESINLESLEWHSPPKPPSLPSDILRARKFNPWIQIIRAEDTLARFLGAGKPR